MLVSKICFCIRVLFGYIWIHQGLDFSCIKEKNTPLHHYWPFAIIHFSFSFFFFQTSRDLICQLVEFSNGNIYLWHNIFRYLQKMYSLLALFLIWLALLTLRYKLKFEKKSSGAKKIMKCLQVPQIKTVKNLWNYLERSFFTVKRMICCTSKDLK